MKSLELTSTAQHHLADAAFVSGILWERGWAVKNGGNISVDITGEVDLRTSELDQFPYKRLEHTYPDLSQVFLLVTGAGTRMRDVANQPINNVCIIRFSNEGSGYHIIHDDVFNSHLVPTSELPTHLAIHQLLKKQGGTQKAVLHTHPTELIALTLIPGFCEESRLNKILYSVQPEAVIANSKGIGLVQYILPGTEQLAEKTVASLQHHSIILWGKHGCIATAKNVQEAFDLIDVMNKSAQLFFLCREAGYTPQGLTEQEIEALKKMV
ncbi:MAG: rhamnulose-1-phosphate aldolase [Ignavibacteriales bacterium]|nr:rhamnulose-1-phosphate aldolase [Ignavibacteriales bacterium]